MCGIIGILGENVSQHQLERMIKVQQHRGPDANGVYVSPDRKIGLAHNRLSIIDLSEAGRQPMFSGDGNYILVFNGEIYNYKELYAYFPNYPFKSQSDSEVLLAAYEKWGEKCVDYFIGMFSFAIWDNKNKLLFCARDRFGVKPFYYTFDQANNFLFASEIKTLHQANVKKEFNPSTWATYFSYGLYDHGENTFWNGIKSLKGGHQLIWKDGEVTIKKWYSLEKRITEDYDERPFDEIKKEYLSILLESIQFRFRADVPVGINLSGGLDSSILLGLVDQYKGIDNEIIAFTFATGDERYDELFWAKNMLAHTKHPHEICYLSAKEVPDLAMEIQETEDEPFGGFPTLAYSRIFQRAKEKGITVLLDGQGMDEQWAGYEYYKKHLVNGQMEKQATGPVQASKSSPFRRNCLLPEFRNLAQSLEVPSVFSDSLRNMQYRDTFISKIPRALRFNDRISMRYGTELREPFLDHRLFELAFQQKPSLKIQGDVQKWLLRKLADDLLPRKVSEAPKRPLQTPQREWLKDELKDWVYDSINSLLNRHGGIWFDRKSILSEWNAYLKEPIDNSFFIWQWLSLSMISKINDQ